MGKDQKIWVSAVVAEVKAAEHPLKVQVVEVQEEGAMIKTVLTAMEFIGKDISHYAKI